MIYIGVDPGRKTGTAIYDSSISEFVEITTEDFWSFFGIVAKYFRSQTPFKIVLENPNLNKPVWAGGNLGMNQKLKIAQDVGRNKEDAYLIMLWCQKNNVDCVEVKPTKSKWNHATFVSVTGCKKYRQTNEHMRDAARLVFAI